jgi:hypothetical protein
MPLATALHVGPGFLAQLAHLIDEADLGRQEGIGGVLDEFGAFQVR